jgi:uncharacterized protein (TIGR03083 family)
MPSAPETLIDDLAEVWSSLIALGEALTAAEWAAPTECPGWTVKDQYAHMIGTESALLGEHSPEPVAAPHTKNPMGELNEGWVARWRPHAGPEVLAAFRDVTDRRLTALRAMTPADWEASIPTPVGPGTYASFMEIRVFDCWAHEQDVRRAVGKPGHLDGPVAELAMARITGSFGFVVGKRVGPPDGSSVEMALTGPFAQTMAVVMAGGRAQPSPSLDAPTVRIRTDGATWFRLGTGRVDPADADVDYDGDTALGRAVVEQLTITP